VQKNGTNKTSPHSAAPLSGSIEFLASLAGENKKHVLSSAKKTRKKTCFMAAPVIVAKKHTMHLTKTQRKKQPSSLVLPLQTLQNTLQLRGLTPKCTFCAQKNLF
jgi:maltooligosyltrehalose synthase